MLQARRRANANIRHTVGEEEQIQEDSLAQETAELRAIAEGPIPGGLPCPCTTYDHTALTCFANHTRNQTVSTIRSGFAMVQGPYGCTENRRIRLPG